jgi:iron-sulfur cluster insertion protein
MKGFNVEVAPAPSTGAPVVFTDSAARRVREIIAAEGNPGLMLRVSVMGGGCSGFQYSFALESATLSDDLVIENGGVKLLVDPLSQQFLAGAEVDYVESLQGAQFTIRNPNATATCGCGTSFSV